MKGFLVLEDGTQGIGPIFEGELFGAPVDLKKLSSTPLQGDRAYGEVVFNTSLTGYQEILTDPSYFGQIVCMTVPHIGNTGVNREDPESRQVWCAGFLVHENSERVSNWRSDGELDTYLKKAGVPALQGIDTRALTRWLRTRGVARGMILPETERARAGEWLKRIPSFEGRDMIREVTTQQSYTWPPKEFIAPVKSSSANGPRVIAVDFGVKWNLLKSLAELGCQVEVVSAESKASEILAKKPDGVFLSNGPGDPSAAPYAVEAIQGLLGKLPIFGVCMGHQLLATALGGQTYKMKFGHRGGNQPVQDQTTGKVEISSHNHGYAVDAKTLPRQARVTHLNLNDQTVEGLEWEAPKGQAPAFSVQYHPEACPGPHDSAHLFERFVSLMKAR